MSHNLVKKYDIEEKRVAKSQIMLYRYLNWILKNKCI